MEDADLRTLHYKLRNLHNELLECQCGKYNNKFCMCKNCKKKCTYTYPYYTADTIVMPVIVFVVRRDVSPEFVLLHFKNPVSDSGH